MLSPTVRHYRDEIQIAKSVINDIHAEVSRRDGCRLLVFGLGYDSQMWNACCDHVTFVEDVPEYISLNSSITTDRVVSCTYSTTVVSSWKMSNQELLSQDPPQKLAERGPFDIVLIDGPQGWGPRCPGRMIPACWTRKLIKDGGLIYVDDAARPLESYIVKKMFKGCKIARTFPERGTAQKIVFSSKSVIADEEPTMWILYERKVGVKTS